MLRRQITRQRAALFATSMRRVQHFLPPATSSEATKLQAAASSKLSECGRLQRRLSSDRPAEGLMCLAPVNVTAPLATIPGIGPITASALAATVADPSLFRSGRHLAAWLGLTPRVIGPPAFKNTKALRRHRISFICCLHIINWSVRSRKSVRCCKPRPCLQGGRPCFENHYLPLASQACFRAQLLASPPLMRSSRPSGGARSILESWVWLSNSGTTRRLA